MEQNKTEQEKLLGKTALIKTGLNEIISSLLAVRSGAADVKSLSPVITENAMVLLNEIEEITDLIATGGVEIRKKRRPYKKREPKKTNSFPQPTV